MRVEPIVADREAQVLGEGMFPNPVESADPFEEQPVPEELSGRDRQSGMELDVAEANHCSTSDNVRGKHFVACQGTRGTNLGTRRRSED